ncbi:hypothetical protein Cgig2_006319 [Carnegiea gigantea]|uniref:Uncharacterized protein n=1 Tax=Carnegiea gigantea TaxID=171969 RepID=A0A9Q1JGU2_9CARY|nr:hypothetical protein Cgig2_006319 [Carnegiea gigantea]
MWSPRIGAPSFISSIDLYRVIPVHGFSSFSKHQQDGSALCPSFELAVAKEAAQCFQLPELPQVIFYAMFLSEAERLGVLHGQTLHKMVSALTELRWSTFESQVETVKKKREREREKERERVSLARPLLAWHSPFFTTPGKWPTLSGNPLGGTRGVPRARLVHFRTTTEIYARRAALDFELLEMVQTTFYAMLLNEAVELGVVSGPIAVDLKLPLEDLRWSSFESWLGRSSRGLMEAQLRRRTLLDGARELADGQEESSGTEMAAEYARATFRWPLREASALRPNSLSVDYHSLCPSFDLGMATQYAQHSNIPEMVQAIFYAMVVNDVAELGLVSRLSMECMIWAMQKLRTAQASRPANPPVNPASSGGPVEDSGLSGAPPASKQARARLTVFETGDATPEQIAAKAEHRQEEERRRLMNQQAKKAAKMRRRLSLLPMLGKRGTITPLLPHHAEGRSAGNRTPRPQEPTSTPKTTGLPRRTWFKSWDLAASGTSEPLKVTEDEVTIAEAFAQGVRAATERRKLEGLLEEALSKAEAEAEAEATAGTERAVKAKEQGYQQSRADVMGYLCRVLVTLAQDFQQDDYFEAYLHYVDER